MGASGLARQHERGPYIRRNRYILSIVIMTLELVAQVDREWIELGEFNVRTTTTRY